MMILYNDSLQARKLLHLHFSLSNRCQLSSAQGNHTVNLAAAISLSHTHSQTHSLSLSGGVHGLKGDIHD